VLKFGRTFADIDEKLFPLGIFTFSVWATKGLFGTYLEQNGLPAKAKKNG
jgi:hypothetical protein